VKVHNLAVAHVRLLLFPTLRAPSPADQPEVKAFAAKVTLKGDKDDPNAAPWPGRAAAGTATSLEGPWSARRRPGQTGPPGQAGAADVRLVGDRFFAVCLEGKGSLLVEARREGDRLLGHITSLTQESDPSPWVGLIVNPERIDGQYTPAAAGISAASFLSLLPRRRLRGA
jgi:hypothetical protein